ncbi:SDR family NAD(P)-dependent oxidoreductase [Luminiphilus sp. nBUS_07]|uniref:SDR family NAD(P)-dependent oxidoreductase n=1 Tax=Luminiphilus sp. nBUS_07 TaxID=3395314 RepID=UPI003EB8E4D4
MSTENLNFPEGTALVLGGSGGVGSAIVAEVAGRKIPVCMTYQSNRERAEEIADGIRNSGGIVSTAQVSLQDVESLNRCVNDIVDRGRLHSVFIATGYDIPQVSIADLTPELWQRVLRADAEGVFNAIYTTLPHLRAGGGGSYVHISSAGLLRYPPLDILSVAPKAAIEELIKGVAKEEGQHNIRANSIAIGVIETGIFLRLREQGVFDDQWVAQVKQNLPLQRFGSPKEVAKMALFLASSASGYTTGQLIPVDGGYGL